MLSEFFQQGCVTLKEELTAYYKSQIEILRELDWVSCDGEIDCEKKGPISIARQQYPDIEIEAVCAGCQYLPTKAGQEPEHLTVAILTATELDEDLSICGGFSYPAILDHIGAFEWACIGCLKKANADAKQEALKERKQEQATQAKVSELEWMRQR